MERDQIVESLEELSSLSEITGENPFKSKAYANAARVLSKSSVPVQEWSKPGVLEAISGVGKGTAERVREFLATGAITDLDAMRAQVPVGVREMLTVPGLGPKKAASLWRELGIVSLGELEYACLENRLVSLPGFGAKTQDKVLAGVRFRASHAGQLLLPAALAAQVGLEPTIGRIARGAPWAWCGEAAQLSPVVSGLDLLVADDAAQPVAESLALSPKGRGEFEGRTSEGLRMTLRAAPGSAFGAARVWNSSSEAFRGALARELSDRGLAWDGSGLRKGADSIDTSDEPAFWRAAGRSCVPPECREFPEALSADCEDLVGEADLRGAFHVHTDWSDGGATLDEMVSAAEALGWEYVGLCDHSASAVYAGGLTAQRLALQREAIAAVQARHPAIRIFAGVESDILGDGALDYPDDVLAGLDLVVASVHSRFNLDEGTQTERLVRAVGHPATTFLGHPTGRLLLSREPYAHRWPDVVDAAARAGKAIELNANPHRLDVDWRDLPGLRGAGVRIAINPDAHSTQGLGDVRCGVWAARKGLARRSDVINTWRAKDVADYLAAGRKGTSP